MLVDLGVKLAFLTSLAYTAAPELTAIVLCLVLPLAEVFPSNNGLSAATFLFCK